jgi:hypothetical protein
LADPFDYNGVDLLEHASGFVRDSLDALELSSVNRVGNSMAGLFSVLYGYGVTQQRDGPYGKKAGVRIKRSILA